MVKAPVIIIKKPRRHGHGHHGGAWKVAYADFVTAMMAFFLVLWIVGQSKSVKAGVAGYFRDPGILDHEKSTGILPGSTTGIDPDGPPELKHTTPEEPEVFDLASMERSAQRLREMLDKLPEFKGLSDQVQIKSTAEGLRIELIDSASSTFFDSSSAVLKPSTERILSVIAREIGTLAKPVVVEGHTDSVPYNNSDLYTNWELSADRANAARRQLERSGLSPLLVRAVRGFADKQLADAADPRAPQNRRVSILVMGHTGPRTIP
jgi:chemotaxis protein MotB